MIVLGSWDSAAYAEPRALEVVRVVRGPAVWRATEYAVGRVVHPSAGTEWVAVRLRGSRRWRPGHSESEAVVWRLAGPDDRQGAGRFEEPATGASIAYVLDGDLERQQQKWRARAGFGRGGTTKRWQYFTISPAGVDPYDATRVRFGRRDLDGAPYSCQTLGAEGVWHDSEHLQRHHLLGSNDADLTDVSEAVVHHLIAQARAAGRFTRSKRARQRRWWHTVAGMGHDGRTASLLGKEEP